MRSKHPIKEIEAQVAHALAKGWRLKPGGPRAHAWGTLLCPRQTREGCRCYIYISPAKSDVAARTIRKEVDQCPHC